MWTDPKYGTTTRTLGVITMEVYYSQGAYHVRIGGRVLKKSHASMDEAKAVAERTAKVWLQDMIAQLG